MSAVSFLWRCKIRHFAPNDVAATAAVPNKTAFLVSPTTQLRLGFFWVLREKGTWYVAMMSVFQFKYHENYRF